MRKLAILCVIVCAGASGLAQMHVRQFEPGHVLVKFKEPGSMGASWAVFLGGSRVKQTLPELGVNRLQLPRGQSVQQALSFYRSMPGVEFAEPNIVVRAQFLPNDPLFPGQYGPRQMSSPTAWDSSKGSPGVIIAIVDTGIDLNHADLVGKIVPGKDFVNNDLIAQDDEGHGTHCAGIAAANINNGIGIAGIAPNCSLMPVKVLDANGGGLLSNVASGIIWAANNGAKVISLSLGAGSGATTMQQAVDYAWGKGAVVVAAAGNSGVSFPSYPAYYTNCIAVGSSDSNDIRSSFSNYGFWVDVAAPGSNILSTLPGSTYDYLSGTSMACPAVAGLAALVFSHLGTQANNVIVRQRIESTCDPIGSWIVKGRVNAYRALTQLGAPTLNGLSLSKTSMIGGTSITGTITIGANQYSAVVVNVSSNSSALMFPPNVSIPAGQSSATFSISSKTVQNQTTASVIAKLGQARKTAGVVVTPAPALSQFTASSYNVDGPTIITGRVTITLNAPVTGQVVNLSSGNPLILGVPISVTVPAGQRIASFAMQVFNVASAKSVSATASCGGKQLQVQIRVY